jgi:hypothetical protein
MITDGERSAVPTMKFFTFSARGLQTNPEDFLDAVCPVGKSSFAGMSLDYSVNVVVPILDINDVPAGGDNLGVDILIVAYVHAAITRDLVVDDYEVVEFPVPREGNGFKGYIFLDTGVSNHTPRGFVDNFESGLVICGTQVLCGHC